METVDLDQVRIDPAWALRVPQALALRRGLLPIGCVGERLYVACADPGDAAALEAVSRSTGRQTVAVKADPEALRRALGRVYGEGQRPRPAAPAREGTAPEADDAVARSAELLHAALLRQASDIHLEPGPDELRVRLRVDGLLEEYARWPLSAHPGLLSRFKVLAGLDIAEKRAPQDGGFSHRFAAGPHGSVDLRAATLPTKHGERMTLRLLALKAEGLTLERLGLSPRDLETVKYFIDRPHGLALLTGPTGSGKTTTLYAVIRRLLQGRPLNVLTIEDPVEYEIGGVSQVEVDAADKVSFHKALRSALRHDPDVLMIGEIRDLETLDTAVKAALTGHLVLSTLHTNSAASTVTRLADLGLPRYLIAATLKLAVAQRLVRRLCPACRAPRPLTPAEAGALGRPEAAGAQVYEAGACVYCAGRGFVGRTGVFEVMAPDGPLAARISAGASEADLAAELKGKGVPTTLDDAAARALAGETTVKEALEA